MRHKRKSCAAASSTFIPHWIGFKWWKRMASRLVFLVGLQKYNLLWTGAVKCRTIDLKSQGAMIFCDSYQYSPSWGNVLPTASYRSQQDAHRSGRVKISYAIRSSQHKCQQNLAIKRLQSGTKGNRLESCYLALKACLIKVTSHRSMQGTYIALWWAVGLNTSPGLLLITLIPFHLQSLATSIVWLYPKFLGIHSLGICCFAEPSMTVKQMNAQKDARRKSGGWYFLLIYIWKYNITKI